MIAKAGRPLIVVVLLFLQGCSVLIDANADQCKSDADCAGFANAMCNLGQHVCVPRPPAAESDAGSDGVPSCQGKTGCYQCTPATDFELLTGCTDSTCIPFDNTRLTNLNTDGTLKPLP